MFAVQVAEALTSAGHSIKGIASPRLRKGKVVEDISTIDRLRAWALRHEVAWTDATELRARNIPDHVHLIISAHSHAFIGRQTRARASIAAIGYHPSLLPLHRGRDAIKWTIRDRDRVTGGTVYHLTERTDGGPIAAQEHILVPPDATVESLWRDQLAPLGVHLLMRVVSDLSNGVRVMVPQDEQLASWEPSMDAQLLFKPELVALPGPDSNFMTDANKWALVA
ncbi:formyltransferase family protein [Janthinobacterium sp. HH01]|uniref:formyltransferase family protein n=1 Tax=Janthinobacterium sp. HH01 TaxID=1198452 RepID=UPI0019554082|nr:formyltransferase family protein [Janthinobacterium sp. HH01]